MKFQRTLTVLGLSVVLAVSAVSVSFAQNGGGNGGGQGGDGGRGRQGPMGRLMNPAPFIGIAFEPVEGGVKIVEVVEGSPAETAGLLVDDVITAVAGQTIGDGNVRDVLKDYQAGDALELTVTRGEETLTVSVTLGERPIREMMRGRAQARLGAVLEEGTLTVAEVAENSPAAAAGLLAGDTITAINGTTVATREEVVAAVAAAHEAAVDGEDTVVTVTVTRDGASVDLSVTLPSRPALPDGMGGMPRLGRGMRGMFLQPRADGSGFDVVIPFTLAEGTTLTPEAEAAIAGLGWAVQPKEGEEGVYELIIPAESVRDGLNLGELQGLEGMEGMLFDEMAFGLPNDMHFEFSFPDMNGEVVPAQPEVSGANL